MTKWVKAKDSTARTVAFVQEIASLYIIAAFKIRKTTLMISQNLLPYLVSYHDMDIKSIYCPAPDRSAKSSFKDTHSRLCGTVTKRTFPCTV